MNRPRAIATLFLIAATAALAGAAPSPPNPAFIGKASMRLLDNGIRLIVEPSTDNEVVAVTCLFFEGARTETDHEQGLTNLAMRVAARASQRLDAGEMSARIESMGASLEGGATEDYSRMSMNCVRHDLDEMLDLLRQVVFEPALAPAQIATERALVTAALRRVEDDKFSFTYRKFLEEIYRGHPYGRDPRGEIGGLEQYTRIEIADRHANVCRSDEMIVSVVGGVDEDALAEAIGHWPRPTEPKDRRFIASKKFAQRARIESVPRDVSQAFIVMGFVTVPVSHPDYPLLRVTSAALGEGMSSRIFKHLRDKAGLAYALGSLCAPRFDESHFACYIGTGPENITRAQTALLKQLEILRDTGVTAKEIDRARNYAIGKFSLAQQTNSARAAYRARCEMAGLGYDYAERYLDRLRTVTRAEVRDAARRYLVKPVTVVLQPEKR